MPHELGTDRVRLRPLRRDDLDDLHAVVLSDPDVTWDGRARSLDESREALERKLGHVEAHGFGFLAAEERDTGAFLGYAGLQHLEEGPDVELGYYLGRRAWGRGLATEIARELMRHAFVDLRLQRVVAVVRPENDASKRVLAKAGLHHEHDAHHYGEDVEVWAASAPPA